MKKKTTLSALLPVAAIFLGTLAYGQVGINNSSPQATLDVTAKTTDGSKPEGFIAPRLTGDQIKAANSRYTASTPIPTGQTGVIVYATSAVTTPNTDPKTAKITAPGYYYFDGTAWQAVKDWSLTGNAGTTPSTAAFNADVSDNFLGTTDANDLVLAAGNREVLRIGGGTGTTGTTGTAATNLQNVMIGTKALFGGLGD